MLHLCPRLIGNPIAASFSWLAKVKLTYHTGQGGIPYLYLLLLCKFLVDPLNPPVTFGVEAAQKLRIDMLLVLSWQIGHAAFLLYYAPDGVPAYSQTPGDLSYPHPFLMKVINGFTLLQIDHKTPLSL